jgi:hypothetical protein
MSNTLLKHTEAAMALLEGKIAEVVYLPPDVRKNKLRLKANGHATTAPLTAKETLDRILAADPVGFLLAIMNGQPVVTFDAVDKKIEVDTDKVTTRAKKKLPPMVKLGMVDGFEIRAVVHVPTIEDRKEVAKFLTPFVTEKRKKSNKDGPIGDSLDGKDPLDEDAQFEELAARRAREASGGSAEG